MLNLASLFSEEPRAHSEGGKETVFKQQLGRICQTEKRRGEGWMWDIFEEESNSKKKRRRAAQERTEKRPGIRETPPKKREGGGGKERGRGQSGKKVKKYWKDYSIRCVKGQ